MEIRSLRAELARVAMAMNGLLEAGGASDRKLFFYIGAASGDRTHDILSHSQAFCR